MRASVLLVLTACGSVSNDPIDGAIAADVPGNPPDAPAAADAAGVNAGALGPWGAPTTVPGLSGDDVRGGSLTNDRTELYFASQIRTGGEGGYDIWKATRPTGMDPFNVVLVPALNGAADDVDPWVSRDGLTIWFSSNRNAAQGYDIYVSVRASRMDPWGIPQAVTNLNTVADEGIPSVSNSELIMIISSTRDTGWDTYASRRGTTGDPWGTPVPIAEVNSPATDYATISFDGLELFIISNRVGTSGITDLYHSSRPTVSDLFSTPTPIIELNTDGAEEGAWMGQSRQYLFFTRQVAGGTYFEAFEVRR